MIKVKVGQVWMDWDIRFRSNINPRKFKVLEVGPEKALVHNISSGLKTKISLRRFKESANGYKLVTE